MTNATKTRSGKMKKRSSTANKNGSKWIRPTKRLRVYDRDEWCCVYCRKTVYSVALVRDQKAQPASNAEPATLDHIICRSSGKANHHESNIVTCCLSCNSQRQDKPVRAFARLIETKNNTAEEIVKRVNKLRRRVLPRLEDLDI